MRFKTFVVFTLYLLINSSFGKSGFGPGEQEWGYVTVRPKAHMFWWLHYTTHADVKGKYEEKPLIIWIQGGPGVSGTAYGNFEELGPLDTDLEPRNYTWIKDYNVLFIDNPVGTGFSYVESLNFLSSTNTQIGEDLVECIREFFMLHPRFSKTPTYILAESYGGKMGSEFANLWYKEQVSGNISSNLKGFGVIDGYFTAEMYKSWAPYLYTFGKIDENGYKQVDAVANQILNAIDEGDYIGASKKKEIIENLIQKLTGHVDRYNIIKRVEPNYRSLEQNENSAKAIYSTALKKIMKQVKTSLGLKSTWGTQEFAIPRTLNEDFPKSAVPQVEKLLNETDLKVFVFNGQLDLIVNTLSTLTWIEKMKWKNISDWMDSSRSPLVVNNFIEGYSKGFGNFKFYVIERSGHMIPANNPVGMGAALKDLIYN